MAKTKIQIKLSREEALATIIALQKEKPYKWQQGALTKIDKAMGFRTPSQSLRD